MAAGLTPAVAGMFRIRRQSALVQITDEARRNLEDNSMVQIDLSDEERKILAGVLDSYLSDLRMEISNTDSMDFREILKKRKAVLQKASRALGASEKEI